MRKHSTLTLPLFVSAAALFLATAVSLASPVTVSVSVFHDQLAPHGRWTAAATYGDVWIPSGVATGWEPYVDGEWVYSDYGWTWVSDDPWGDVPYHYGTWARVEPYGWVWVPGTVWAPAWVTWAYTDDYVGWAPVPPSFAISASGYYGSAVVLSPARYIFVPTRQFVGVRVATVRIPSERNVTIFPRATKTTRFQVSNGIVRTAGPPASRIEKVIGHSVERVPGQRLRVQPTTLAAAGVTHNRSIRVVAPAAERRGPEATAAKASAKKATGAPRSAKAESGQPRGEKNAAQSPEAKKARREKASSTERHPEPRAATPAGDRTSASDRGKPSAPESSGRPKSAAKKPEPKESSAKPGPKAEPNRAKDAGAGAPPERQAQHDRPEARPPQPATVQQHPQRQPESKPREAPPKQAPPRQAPPKEEKPPALR